MIVKNADKLEEAREGPLRAMRKSVLEAVEAAVESVLPRNLLRGKLKVESGRLTVMGHEHDLARYDRIYVIGGGKAAFEMASTLYELLGDKISGGEVAANVEGEVWVGPIRVSPASHPIPDEKSYEAAKRVLELASKATPRTLYIVVVSGGGSAMLAHPRRGITLEDKVETTRLLLKSGANIEEVNTVRKHLSAIKGGQLQRLIHPATSITLILSDVVGDRLDLVASGPTLPDPTTFQDAKKVLEKYGLLGRVPQRVVELIERGIQGLEEETPKPGSPIFETAHHYLIGSNRDACMAAWHKLAEKGYTPILLTTQMQGEAREVGRLLAGIASSKSHPEFDAYILGGETTVTVRGKGRGGRNQELCLSALIALKGVDGVVLCSFGTDGVDGFSAAAGALVDGQSYCEALAKNLSPEEHLENNDSATFFEKAGGAIITGPTGTNVADVVILVKGAPRSVETKPAGIK